MAVMTTERLSASVGAEIVVSDPDALLEDEALPSAVLEALETHGALVFRNLHIDDATQVAFSKRLGRVEVFGTGENPEIFRVTLDPTKNKAAVYLRGTFDWHIDGCTDDVPIMATLLAAHEVAESGRDRVRQHLHRLRRPGRRGEGALRLAPDRPLHRGLPAPLQPRSLRRGAGPVAIATREGASVGVDPPVGAPLAGPRRHCVPRGGHGA